MYKNIIQNLLKGDASDLTADVISNIGQITVSLLMKEPLSPFEVDVIGDILHISNIIYNNTDRSILVLEDGVYDVLLQKYRRYHPNFQVGAEPVHFDNLEIRDTADTTYVEQPMSPFTKVNLDRNSMLFYKDIYGNNTLRRVDKFNNENKQTITKRLKTINHVYPELVGTLDKAKFTLNQEAMNMGVFDDPNVVIFERDFLQKHLMNGIINRNDIALVLELKYDGVSVEAEVTDRVVTARTRGDTDMDKASDLTPILNGYPFTDIMDYCEKNNKTIQKFGMKFEAILDNFALQELERLHGIKYASARNAIIGIFSRADARKYAHYITLVPLQTSIENMNREEEIEYMNKWYSNGVKMSKVIIRGDYQHVLFMVYKFVREAQEMRPLMPFLYDGVVVSYLDPNIRTALGRKHHVNQYSIAIKFNTNKKYTRFTGYEFTVGKDGTITPMIHFDPVEFFGGIHTKASGHSFGRFKKLCLRKSDIVEAEFRNDVMVYIDKPPIDQNIYNPNPVIQFPIACPECGERLVFTEENAVCPNLMCKGRRIARVTDMLTKLGFKGFAESAVRTLNLVSFTDLINLTDERCYSLGNADGVAMINAINEFTSKSIPDYVVLGSLGFSNIAIEKFKKILSKVSLSDLINLDDASLGAKMSSTKGIGNKTAMTILNERKMFFEDLINISKLPNIIRTSEDKGVVNCVAAKTIRMSGVRDQELMFNLCSLGHDCSEGAVTKNTDILLIPFNGFTSAKVNKAIEYNSKGSLIKIVPIDEFRINMRKYVG